MPISKIHSASIPDSVAIDTDVLVVDGVNNRVGIGTATPLSALHIDAANGAGNFIRIHDGNPSYGFGMGCGSSGDLIFTSYDGGNPQEFMRIDRNSGYITKPNQVAFGGYSSPTGSGNRTYVSGTYYRKINYGTATHETAFNVGSHFNTTTGIFTAPIQGTYVFHMRYSQGIADGRKIYQFQMPNGNFIEIAEDFKQHGDEHAAILVKMNANDTVSTGLHSGIQDNVTVFFSGYLLG